MSGIDPGPITVDKKTRERLRKAKAEGETWDDLLNRAADRFLGGGERQ